MKTFLFVLLQAGQQNPLMSMLPIVLVIVVMYFFMIRPQMKKTKQQKEFREKLAKGDKIVTIGGIHGRITEVMDTTFMIEIDNGVKVKIQKDAVSMDNSTSLSENNTK